jgi:hypothetical protein
LRVLLAAADVLVDAIDVLDQSRTLVTVDPDDTTLCAAIRARYDFDGVTSANIHLTND